MYCQYTEEDITIINTYAPNIGAPQYVKRMLTIMKGKISSNTIIVGDINIPLTSMDRSTKQKICKETQTLNDTMDQLDLIHIYRTFQPQTMNFNFFSSAHGTFSRIDHILGHKSAAAAAAAKSLQSCLTLGNPRDGNPPGSPIPGILQARILKWVAISFSNA